MQPGFGILYRNSKVCTEVIKDVGADTLQTLISQKVSTGSIVCSDTSKVYTGIATRRYVHRFVNHSEIKRKLSLKCGIRREKLCLYLGVCLEEQLSNRSGNDKKFNDVFNCYVKVRGYGDPLPYFIMLSLTELFEFLLNEIRNAY